MRKSVGVYNKHTVKETADDHRIISVFSNQCVTSHRSLSGTQTLCRWPGIRNSASLRKQKEKLCERQKCGRVKTCGLSKPLHVPEVQPLRTCDSSDP